MGLLDVLKGMQNGPHGQPQPSKPGSEKSGGMSPLMMALLGLLAYKAFKGSGSHPNAVPSDTGRAPSPPAEGGGLGDILGGMLGGAKPGSSGVPGSTGGFGDILGGLLGGKPGSTGMPGGGGGLGDILGGMLGGGKPGNRAMPSGGGGLGDILGGLLGSGAAGSVLGGGLGNLVKDLQAQGYGKAAQSWVSTGPNESISPQDLEGALGSDTLDALSAQTGMPRSELLQGLSQQLPEMVNELTPDGRLPTEQEVARWV
jgi:uncharacterized protein YidB (DUF937 family)